jgi:indolepyruvate ferredoxin oxidoreductase alpha subunit
MGASIAMASGVYHSGAKEPSVAVIGDGTFYHAGMPSLMNAVHNWSNITVVIFDNSITAMTGHQPNPGTGTNIMRRSVPHANLKKVVQALGVEHVQVISAYDTKKLVEAVLTEMAYEGPSVIISKAPCAIVVERELRKRKLKTYKAKVDLDKCTGCKSCMKKIGCPAFGWSTDPKPHVTILPHCNGCGLCIETCPFKAISVPGKKDSIKGISVRTEGVKQ